MADETNSEGAEPQAGEQPNTSDDRHAKRMSADLQKYKGRARELETKLAEIEAEKASYAEQQELSKGEWSKVQERYEAKVKKLEARVVELEGLETQRVTDGRRGSFAEAIAKEAGLANAKTVARLLPSLGLESDAPETFDKQDVKAAIKALQSEAPELFGTKTSGAIKPPPGSGERPIDKNSADFWARQAQRDSSGVMSPAYAKATGRTAP